MKRSDDDFKPEIDAPIALETVVSSALVREMAHAIRMLWRDRAFACVALLTMSLGIAGVATLFSLANGVLLRPLPWTKSDRLIRVVETRQGLQGRIPNTVSNGTYLAWSDSPTTIESIAGWREAPSTFSGPIEPERISTAFVTASIFDVLLVRPSLGRVFTPGEGAPGTAGAVLLSHGFWRDRFGSRDDIIGGLLRIDGRPHTIVGVMPPSFAFPDRSVRAWVPMTIPAVHGGGVMRGMIFRATARLKPGVTPAQAAAEATARARSAPDAGSMAVALFGARGPIDIAAPRELDALTSDVAPAIAVLFAGVLLLLGVVTANVASLHLTRATRRRRELAIRAAIGASAGDLIRQGVVDCAIFGAAASIFGLLSTAVAVRMLPAIVPSDFPRLDNVSIDWRVVVFTAGIAISASLVSGLLPLLSLRRLAHPAWLADEGRAPVGGRWRSAGSRTRSVLMTLQVATVCMLLVAATLFSRSLLSLIQAERGYDPVNVLTARVPFGAGYTDAQRVTLMEQLAERLAKTAHVESVGFGNALPFVSSGGFQAVRLPSTTAPGALTEGEAMRRVVSPGFFAAMRLRVIAGRGLTPADNALSRSVVVVNRSFARRYLADLILDRFSPRVLRDIGVRVENAAAGIEVVGVIEDMRQEGVDKPPQPEIFLSYRQVSAALLSNEPVIVARTAGDPLAVAPALRSFLAELDRSLALDSIMAMDARVSASLARPRAYTLLLAVFATIALLIAGVGLFGALAYAIAHRTRELAVRVALGARRGEVLRLVLGQAVVVTGIGLAAGLGVSLGLASSLAPFLYGVSPRDPGSFATVGVAVALMSVAACSVPALRALRVDPAVALRCE